MCERLSAAGVSPAHPVFRRAAAALREAAEREPDVEVVRTARAAAARVEAPTYLGRGEFSLRPTHCLLPYCLLLLPVLLHTAYCLLTYARSLPR